MVEPSRPRLVGHFIRQRREAAGLSQKALGMMFIPPVTTQFISNLERGVTPLPLNHVPTLTQALGINKDEIMTLLEQEYTLKLSGRLGGDSKAEGDERANGSILAIRAEHLAVMKNIYDAYRQADPKTQEDFLTACAEVLRVSAKR